MFDQTPSEEPAAPVNPAISDPLMTGTPATSPGKPGSRFAYDAPVEVRAFALGRVLVAKEDARPAEGAGCHERGVVSIREGAGCNKEDAVSIVEDAGPIGDAGCNKEGCWSY